MLAVLMRLCSLALSSLAWCTLAAYWLGRLATDSFHLTQFLFFAPGWIYLTFAASSAAAALFFRGVQRRILTARLARAAALPPTVPPPSPPPPPKARPRLPTRRLAPIAFVAILALSTACLTLGEYRLWRLVAPAMPATGTTIRIAHWNAMANMPVRADMFIPLAADSDASPATPARPLDILCWSAAMSSMQARDVVKNSLGPAYQFDQRGILFIASRHPIISVESFHLNLAGPIANHRPLSSTGNDPSVLAVTGSEPRSLLEYLYNTYGPAIGLQKRAFRNADPGTLLVAKLNVPSLNRPLVIYYIDLPSDPLRAKRTLAHSAAKTIATFRQTFGEERLPPPDILLGDFNIPRGSGSLALLAPGMTSAFDAAGAGIAATWPYAQPLVNIDHIFLAGPLRATRFEIVDPHRSDHMAIRAEFTIDPPR